MDSVKSNKVYNQILTFIIYTFLKFAMDGQIN